MDCTCTDLSVKRAQERMDIELFCRGVCDVGDSRSERLSRLRTMLASYHIGVYGRQDANEA